MTVTREAIYEYVVENEPVSEDELWEVLIEEGDHDPQTFESAWWYLIDRNILTVNFDWELEVKEDDWDA